MTTQLSRVDQSNSNYKSTPEHSLVNDKTQTFNSLVKINKGSFEMVSNGQRIKFQSTFPLTICRSFTNHTMNKTNIQSRILTRSKDLLILNDITKHSNCVNSQCNIIDRKVSFSILNQETRKLCLLCKNMAKKYLSNASCRHTFCDQCIRRLIKQNFLKKDDHFKCPIGSCNSNLDIDLIREFYLAKECFSENDNPMNCVTNGNNNIEKFSDNKIKIFKKYNKKHMIDANPSNKKTFIYYMKNKKRFCINCFSDKLYSPHDSNFVICLNCLIRVCNKCFKLYDEKHLDKTRSGHCPFVSKNINQNYHNYHEGKCFMYLNEILMLIIGYLVLFVGYQQYILSPIKTLMKKVKGTILYYFLWVLIIITGILFTIIELFVFLIITPYISGINLLSDIIFRLL